MATPLKTRTGTAPDGATVLEILDRSGNVTAIVYTTAVGVRVDSVRTRIVYLSLNGAIDDETRPCVEVTFTDLDPSGAPMQ